MHRGGVRARNSNFIEKAADIADGSCLVAKSCLTLCDPMVCNVPGSSGNEISQARILERVAISFSRGSSQPRDRNFVSCLAGRFYTTEPLGKPEVDRPVSQITILPKLGCRLLL